MWARRHGCGAAPPLPDAYVPKHLVDKILTSKSAMEGERKQVTVLFADLKGSMELLAERDPEEARKILDPVLERLMDAVHRYEGTVNQVMGDGIMALFGAPLAHEDHTARACYAALLMQESVERYASDVHAFAEGALKIRIGLNAGEVVVRSIGNDLRMDYTAVGQTTHLAARMEQMAPPGSILIPADALRLAEGYVEVKSLGRFTIKGLAHPIEVCEVIGAGMARTRFQVSAARGLTRFVGRDAEIDELHRTLKQARNGQGQILAVVGEAGMGKSRLFHEFIHSPSTEGCLVLQCGSVSYGKARSYLPIIDLLKVYFRIEDRDDRFTIREKVTARLLTVGEALHSALPAFLALLDVPLEDASWQALDPAQRRHRTLSAVQGLLLWESRVQPLLIAVENLHWIDSQTQGLLDSLVTSLPTAPILLLVNYRPEYHHAWANRTYYRQIRIDPLAPESAEALLRALLGDDVTLQPLKRLLIERTEGNPFFLEESVRTLVETGVLAGERGAYRLAKDVTSIQVAPTVQAVLAARIDRLSSENKRLLQCAAVIGKDVPFTLLRAIADAREDDVQGVSAIFKPPSSCTRRTCFPILSTPSSTLSRTRSPTAASSRIVGALSTPVSWKPSRRSIRTAGPSRWNGSPIMPSAPRCGKRRRRICVRRGARRLPAPPIERQRRISSRRSPRWSICRKRTIRCRTPSTSASTFETRSSPWESSTRSMAICAKQRRSRESSAISAASAGPPCICVITSG